MARTTLVVLAGLVALSIAVFAAPPASATHAYHYDISDDPTVTGACYSANRAWDCITGGYWKNLLRCLTS